MARKRRKPSTGRSKKKSKAPRKKSRSTVKKRKLRRRRPLGGEVASAFRTAIDTIKDTDQLRNKMEPPASSETE